MSIILPSMSGFAHTSSAFAYSLDDTHGIEVVPALHLDASILDGADAGNNPSDGTAVATWGDRSGNGNDLAEATNQPSFKASWQNGKPAVEFDGTNDTLADSDFFSNVDFTNKDATMVIVYQPQDDSAYSLTITGRGSYGDEQSSDIGSASYSSCFLGTRMAGAAFAGDKGVANGFRSAGVYGLRIDNSSTSYKVYQSKQLQIDYSSSYNGSTFGTPTDNAFRLSYTQFFNGYIAEVLIFNEVLTDTDWDMIHTYIDSKYWVHSYNDVSGSYALDGSHSTSVTPVAHWSAQSNLYQADGSAAGDTNSVAKWTDKARGYHGISVNAPVLNTNQLNTSLSGVYFDGTNDYMEVFMPRSLGTFGYSDNTNVTYIFLFEPDNVGTYTPIGAFNSTGNDFVNASWGTLTDLYRSVRYPYSSPETDWFTSTGAQIATVRNDDAANSYVIYNGGGTASITTTQSVPGRNDKSQMVLGASAVIPSTKLMKGWLYEVLIFDTALSTSDMNQVGQYLDSVYGVSYTDIS